MLNSPCQVLSIEDDPEDIETIGAMLKDVRSTFFKLGIELSRAETLAEAKQMLSAREFDVILLDLMLPDSRGMDSLRDIQAESLGIPIIVQTALEDEVVAVQALELGACGYLPKIVNDRNLLLYALRSAIERQQQLSELGQPRQQQELDNLENLMADGDSAPVDSLKQRMPDVFDELEQRYSHLLQRFVEQKIYKVEYELEGEINVLIEQLGYLQATPRDAIELHATVLKQMQSQKRNYNKASMVEGRYLLLELMGKLAAYYRRYYIGLSKINLTQERKNAM